MGKASPPPPPDYRGAAEETAESSRIATNQQMYFNRPTVSTPFGGESWEYKPVTDPVTGEQYTTAHQTTTLTPEAQEALSAQLRIQGARSGFAEDMLGRVEQGYQEGPDYGQFGEYTGLTGDTEQRREDAFGRMSSLYAPQREQDRSRLETQLSNQGIQRGTRAWDNAMRSLGDAEMRQDMQMMQGSMAEAQGQLGMDVQQANYLNNLRQMQIAEMLQERQTPLNELNALLTGQQVSAPQMPGFQAAGRSETTDYMGAAQAQGQYEMDIFNAEQASKDALMSGAMNMGSSMMMCDIRVKRNLEHIGYYEDDIPCYAFQYIWSEEWFVGPVAQEVEEKHPELVVEYNGIKHVDMRGLGYAH